MAYHINLTWTVADTDRVQKLARQGFTARKIALKLGRSESDIIKLCDDNSIFVRTSERAAR